jgi:4-hydroxyphenylacetate 3-monooxygenase
MQPRTGAEHIASLRDGRAVLYRGARIDDVTEHPAFRNAVRSAARLYDHQARPDRLEAMTFLPEGAPRRIGRMWELPETHDQLLARRRALEEWATLSCGFLGRGPDHVASCLAGMMMGIEVFEAHDKARAAALRDYWRHVRDNDFYLTYALISPQADRGKGASEQDEDLVLRLLDRDAQGITVRGARMLATGAVLANEMLVTSIQPLQPGRDEAFALSFAVPLATPGLHILSRRSYEEAAEGGFDHPLSFRFDENDAVLWFEDVRIPWERVFVCGDTGMCAAQFHATPAHVFQNYQAQVRLSVKLRFLAGLAHRIAEVNGTLGYPQVREALGEVAAEAAMVEGLLAGMEAKPERRGGYLIPDRHLLYAAQTLTQPLYGRLVARLRELAGGGLIMLPASVEDLRSAETGPFIRRTQRSPVATPEERVRFMKLAWDALGSEFAGRHAQYELFYAGAPSVPRNHSFRTYDWEAAARLVQAMLAEPDAPLSAAAE